MLLKSHDKHTCRYMLGPCLLLEMEFKQLFALRRKGLKVLLISLVSSEKVNDAFLFFLVQHLSQCSWWWVSSSRMCCAGISSSVRHLRAWCSNRQLYHSVCTISSWNGGTFRWKYMEKQACCTFCSWKKLPRKQINYSLPSTLHCTNCTLEWSAVLGCMRSLFSAVV